MHSGCLTAYSISSNEEVHEETRVANQAANHQLYRDCGRLMRSLPLCPLKSLILPGGYLRIRVFEPNHISMVSTCIRNGGGFGAYLDSVGPEAVATQVFRHGTMVDIVDWDREGDGLLVVVVEGLQKFRVVETNNNSNALANSNGLLVGEVEMLPPEKKVAVPSHHRELSDLLRRVFNRVRPFGEYANSHYTDAAWVSNRLSELLPMTVVERNNLMAITDPIERLSVLEYFVERFTESDISGDSSETVPEIPDLPVIGNIQH